VLGGPVPAKGYNERGAVEVHRRRWSARRTPSRPLSPTGSSSLTASHGPRWRHASQTCTALSRRRVRCRCLCRVCSGTMDPTRQRRRTWPPTTPGD